MNFIKLHRLDDVGLLHVGAPPDQIHEPTRRPPERFSLSPNLAFLSNMSKSPMSQGCGRDLQTGAVPPYPDEPLRNRSKPVSKRKRTAAEKRARRERKKKFMIIFVKGKQKWVPRPQLIDGLPVDEFIARNADPIWLHQNELWELMPE